MWADLEPVNLPQNDDPSILLPVATQVEYSAERKRGYRPLPDAGASPKSATTTPTTKTIVPT